MEGSDEGLSNQLLEAARSGDKELLFQLIQNDKKQVGKVLQQQNSEYYFLHTSCQYGHVDIVALLSTYCDMEETSPEGTALQIACHLGYVDIVEILLINGAILSSPQPHNDSCPFMMAAAAGWRDVLHALLFHRYARLIDTSVLMGLVHKASTNGHLHILKYCLEQAAAHDILTDEVMTQLLHVVCKAGFGVGLHELINKGGNIDQTILTTFHSTVVQALDCYIQCQHSFDGNNGGQHTQSEEILVSAYLSKKNFSVLSGVWLQKYQHTLVDINLSGNRLSSLPDILPWNMTSLNKLNLSHNRLENLPELCGSEIKCENLQIVNISFNQLQLLPLQLFQIQELEYLYVNNNKIIQLSVKTVQPKEMVRPSNRRRAIITDGELELWNCQKMKTLDLTCNKLNDLPEQITCCKSLTILKAQENNLTRFPLPWLCPLMELQLSHNALKEVPCSLDDYWGGSLQRLNLSHNHLTELTQGLCRLGLLKELDVSHNNLTQLPRPSWWEAKGLRDINFSHNKLSIVPYNTRLSDGSDSGDSASCTGKSGLAKWIAQHKSPSTQDTDETTVEFPASMADNLTTLNLSHNLLTRVPPSVIKLTSLNCLDISHNTIQHLPPELGNLQKCYHLGLDGLNLTKLPASVNKVSDAMARSKLVMTHLRHCSRRSVSYYTFKLMVVGRENKGKTTLIDAIMSTRNTNKPNVATNGVRIHYWKPALRSSQRKEGTLFKTEDSSTITAQIWDFAGQRDYYVTHKVFLCEKAVFLLVFDLRTNREGICDLKPWLLDISAHAPGARVILVGTFLDEIIAETKNSLWTDLCTTVKEMYPREKGYPKICSFCPVSGVNREGLDTLKDTIYREALQIQSTSVWGRYGKDNLLGMKVPQSYQELEKLITQERKKRIYNPVLSYAELLSLVGEIPHNDIKTEDDLRKAIVFLNEIGTCLNFNDQTGGLSGLFFIDPSWLANTLARFITVKAGNNNVRDGILQIADAQAMLFNDVQGEERHLEQYVELLERFGMAFLLDSARLLIPSKLSTYKPGFQLPVTHRNQGFTTMLRFYKMSLVPSGLWSRLITRLLIMIDVQILQKGGHNDPDKAISEQHQMLRQSMPSFGRSFTKSVNTSPTVVYWQEGIFYSYDQGYFCVEAASHYSGTNDHPEEEGVLVKCQSLSGNFTAAGFVMDQIESVLVGWFQGLLDTEYTDEPPIQQLAICPKCVASVPGKLILSKCHVFPVHQCALTTFKKDQILCPKCQLNIPLNCLIPDLFLTDIPPKLHLDRSQIIRHERLGHGGEASVYKGELDGKAVAIKQNHIVMLLEKHSKEFDCNFERLQINHSRNASDSTPTKHRDSSSGSSSGSDASGVSESALPTSQQEIKAGNSLFYTNVTPNVNTDAHDVETESNTRSSSSTSSDRSSRNGSAADNNANILHSKLLQALRNFRQEATVLGHLSHPYIVELYGVCVATLSIVLNLSPCGSLRSILDNTIKSDGLPSIHHTGLLSDEKQSNYRVGCLLGRTVTHKVILQICAALQYLHGQSIIYKDLKCDNILVWEADIATHAVTVRLSDYGLSTYTTPQGAKGMVGTPGYQAPEMLQSLLYKEKVDIFALGMTIYELATGYVPYHQQTCALLVQKAIRNGERPDPNNDGIDLEQPQLEALMQNCLQSEPKDRMSAADIISKLSDCSFVCHKKSLGSKKIFLPEIDVAAPYYTTHMRKSQKVIKGWNGEGDHRQYHVLNIPHGQSLIKEMCPGPRVICMVNKGRFTILGNMERELEILYPDPSNGRLAHIEPKLSLHSMPLMLDCFHIQGKDLLFVGFDDGVVQVYTMLYETECDKLSLSNPQTLQTSEGQMDMSTGVTCATHVEDGDELWLASGVTMIIVDTSPGLRLAHRIPVYEPNPASRITACKSHGDQVWCIASHNFYMVEIDARSKSVLCRFDCSASSILHDVIANFSGDSHRGDQVPMTTSPTQTKHRKNNKMMSMRKRSLQRQKRRRPVSSLRAGHHGNQPTDILFVNGCIWVSRQTGDIVAVNVTQDNAMGHEYGQVLAILCDEYRGGRGDNCIRKLYHMGNELIVAQRKKKTEILHKPAMIKTELILWQAWGPQDFYNFNFANEQFKKIVRA